MAEPLQVMPILHWKASDSIADPEISISSGFAEEANLVTTPTRLDLLNGNLTLLFKKNEIAYLIPIPRKSKEPLPIYQLLYFIVYKTRINYNVFYYPDEYKLDPKIPSSSSVSFCVERLERKEQKQGDHLLVHHESHPHEIRISTGELENFLKCATPQLLLSNAYYLIGCQQIRYFLVEFYKCLEVIKKSFKNEAQMLKDLESHGLKKGDYKKLTKYCNDDKAPIDIGRHAPRPDAPVQTIDLRNLLTEPKSREIFSESVRICRQTIDAYLSYLLSQDA